jgi:hypothetical protein
VRDLGSLDLLVAAYALAGSQPTGSETPTTRDRDARVREDYRQIALRAGVDLGLLETTTQ